LARAPDNGMHRFRLRFTLLLLLLLPARPLPAATTQSGQAAEAAQEESESSATALSGCCRSLILNNNTLPPNCVDEQGEHLVVMIRKPGLLTFSILTDRHLISFVGPDVAIELNSDLVIVPILVLFTRDQRSGATQEADAVGLCRFPKKKVAGSERIFSCETHTRYGKSYLEFLPSNQTDFGLR
jgi:hypothetical protein